MSEVKVVSTQRTFVRYKNPSEIVQKAYGKYQPKYEDLNKSQPIKQKDSSPYNNFNKSIPSVQKVSPGKRNIIPSSVLQDMSPILKSESQIENVLKFDQTIFNLNSSPIKQDQIKNKKDKVKAKELKQKLKLEQAQKGEVKVKVHNIPDQGHIYGKLVYEEIIQKCKVKNMPFLDHDFYPNEKHIGGDFVEYVEWRRSNEFMKSPLFFEGGIEPTDICQGELGDCYLLSSLAALCEWPQLIKNLFNTRKVNEQGVISVRVCWKGVWTEILMDDYFPTYEGMPVFSSCSGEELWVLSMEKAWAKLHGSYFRIDGAFAREPLHDLTGAPTRTYKPEFGKSSNTEKNKHIWKMIKAGENNDHAMCAGSVFYDEDTEECEEFEQTTGLISGHIYTLISCISLKINNEKVKLVKLRNPWGDHEWLGKYNDDDQIWNDVPKQTKQNIGFSDEQNDGIFFMCYNDFLKNFDDVSICFQYPTQHFIYEGVPLDISKGTTHFFRVELKKMGYYFFQVCQRSIRVKDAKISENPKVNKIFYSNVLMFVQNSENDQKICQISGKSREVCDWSYIEHPHAFNAGLYYAYVKIDPSDYQQEDAIYGFGVYGCSSAEIQEINEFECGNFSQVAQNINEDDYEFYH